MKLRQIARHASIVSLLIALPIAALGGSGAGCAKAGLASGDGTMPGSDGGGVVGLFGDGGGPQPIPVCVRGTLLMTDPSQCTAGATSVGPSPLRRISRVEYNNMVRDLLGDSTHPADQFVSESPLANGVNFNSNTYTYVTDTLIPQQYLQAAETLAAGAVGQNQLQSLMNGVPANACANHDDNCAQAFIDWFANRAFRGQYDSTESSALMGIYSTTKAQFDFATGIQAVITAVLTSPRFLFVFEFGAPGNSGAAMPLSPYEIATRLSLFLWRSFPDDALLQAAASNQLGTPDQIQSQATRMLGVKNGDGSLKAADALYDFVTQWMELENTDSVTKDTQFASWSASLADGLKQETLHTFANEVLVENNGAGASLNDLLTSDQSYINTAVAKFYGVSGGDDSYKTKTGVNPSSLPSPIRAGILTNGSVMATQAHTTLTSPTLRGKLVREQVLCDPMPPPPAAVNNKPIPPPAANLSGGLSTRQQDEQVHLTHDMICFNCHQYMNPIGFAFGNFDTTGAYQATDSNGADSGTFPEIDASSVVNPMTADETTIAFGGPVDLANKLAGDPLVAACFALQEMRYALGRIEGLEDACSAQQIYQAFKAGNLNLQGVLMAIVRSDSFRFRSSNDPSASCVVEQCK
jgi:Protein of unknown function (DUF1592)/Protein of unknown function (DUF1588)/Protein of unknown function (DUF1595)/Protein of unknown function (DUF1585)/Protein of unknown function (DUF1587)